MFDSYADARPATRARKNVYGFCSTDCQARAVRVYGKDSLGRPIVPPEGWEIIPEGERVPNGYIDWEIDTGGREDHGWVRVSRRYFPVGIKPAFHVRPRIINTMTPITAQVWGSICAFARPQSKA